MSRTQVATKGRSCEGKRRHRSRVAAEAHRQELIDKGACGDRLKVYSCRHCPTGTYHVGHIGRRAAAA